MARRLLNSNGDNVVEANDQALLRASRMVTQEPPIYRYPFRRVGVAEDGYGNMLAPGVPEVSFAYLVMGV